MMSNVLTRCLVMLAVMSSLFAAVTIGCMGHEQVLRTRDGKLVGFERMIEDLMNARVVFVGETHKSERDHRSQMNIIGALHSAGVPLAIGLEMFREDSQRALDKWVKGSIGLDEFLKVYYDNWKLPWPLYREVFLFSKEQGIPMVGLNVPGEITEKVFRQGFSSLTGEELRRLPPGISCDVDEQYMEFIRRAYSLHEMRGKGFVNFCEAQMVWDKAMAWNLRRFLESNPGTTVVVLAGVGHSWKKGIPEQMGKLLKVPYAVVLPEVPGRIDRNTALVRDADYILPR